MPSASGCKIGDLVALPAEVAPSVAFGRLGGGYPYRADAVGGRPSAH
jgi:hypothetical protein